MQRKLGNCFGVNRDERNSVDYSMIEFWHGVWEKDTVDYSEEWHTSL